MTARRISAGLVACVVGGLWSTPGAAHPHVWIEAALAIEFQDGRPARLRQSWLFDAYYSSFARERFDDDHDGRLDDRELHRLAIETLQAVQPFGYFTHAVLNGRPVEIPEVAEAQAVLRDDLVRVDFSLPLPADGATSPLLTLSLHDPTRYVAVGLRDSNPVSTVGAPAGCGARVERDGALVRLFSPAATELVRLSCAHP